MAKGRKTGGRQAGTPNKATNNARQAIALLIEGNIARMQGWLDEIAADPKQGPRAAWDCLMDAAEYHIPKLARTEHTGEGGGPVRWQAVERKIVKPGKPGANTAD